MRLRIPSNIMQLVYLSCVRDSVIFDARLPCAHTSSVFLVLRHAQGTGTGQNRTRSTDMRVYMYTITINFEVSRPYNDHATHCIAQDYATVFRDSGSEVIFPENSGGVGRSGTVALALSSGLLKARVSDLGRPHGTV